MGLKNYFIKKTEREGLLYSFVDATLFFIRKWFCYLKHGHFIRRYRIKKYINGFETKKLHLGCGNNCLKGFLNSDIFGKVPVDITTRLPFNNRTFDLIYSSHVIEHIYLKEFKLFLSESYRILKFGGTQIIQTPSIEKVSMILYDKKGEDRELVLDYHKQYCLSEVCGSTYINDLLHLCFGHKYLYDFDLLSYLGKGVGYSEIIKVGNYCIPDSVISEKVFGNGKFWDLTTESFLLKKGCEGVKK